MQNEINFDDPKLQMILEQTVELFSEFGIRNLNMDDISRSLGISKKTLYQYVKSKEDLIEKLFYYEEVKWNNQFLKLKIDELNAIEILLKASLLVSEEMGRMDPKTKFELRKYYATIFEKFIAQKHINIFKQMSKNIQKGIAEGLYRSDVNVELVAGLYVRNLVDMHNKDYCFNETITFDEVFEVMFENHIRAISTPEGIAYFEKRKSEFTHLNKNINNL
ncbi:MAG TPA: TetR/AcrR family transcriptional regulator [Prolixibacteraceae bacterium]|nr:TetR/AcrR family transcriptional regulator [Prolixibacteraceae bacterium]